jgi:hypothetical protein
MSASDTHGFTYIPGSVSTSLKIHYLYECENQAISNITGEYP